MPMLVNSHEKVGSHIAGPVLGNVGAVPFKQLINGLKPHIEPFPKMFLLQGIIEMLVDLHVCFHGIPPEFTHEEEVSFPEIGQLFKMRGPILDDLIKNIANLVIVPHLGVKGGNQFKNVLPVPDILLHI